MINPRYFKGPKLIKKSITHKTGFTWKEGQFYRLTDSGAVPVKALGLSVRGMYAQTNPTSSVTTAVVWEIPSSSTKLIMAVGASSASGTDTKAPATMKGGLFGIGVSDCVCYVAKSADTSTYEKLYIEERYADVEGFKNDTSDVPGLVIVSIPDAVLTAEGAGV